MKSGSLLVVGTGITFAAHMTAETSAAIKGADKVFYALADPAMASWVSELNHSAESLPRRDDSGVRRDTYKAWVDVIAAHVRRGYRVCAVFYGHPGVFVYAGHEAIRKLRLEGYAASMLPGISADACLFADLGIDPARDGCQSFDATDFLVRKRRFDTSTTLVLWQIGATGDRRFSDAGPDPAHIEVLLDFLTEHYGRDHEVLVYEAPRYALGEPVMARMKLHELSRFPISLSSTLCVPALTIAPPDLPMLRRLGLASSSRET